MRVPSSTVTDNLVYQLNQLVSQQNRLQTQATTGQRLLRAADDPGAMQRVLNLQTEASQVVQYQKNIATLTERANASLDAMRAVKRLSDRASEIATLADGTKSREQLGIYAKEVGQLIRQAAQNLNAKFGSDYLFSGTKSNQTPFAITEDADGHVTAVTYQGNTQTADVPIDETQQVSVQVPGANTTASGPRGLVADSRVGADLFQHLIDLQNHLLAGDTGAIASRDRPGLDHDEDNLLLHISNNAALQARLEAAGQLARSREQSVERLVSGQADADLAETLVRLSATQNAYKAALQSGSILLDQSLLDYL